MKPQRTLPILLSLILPLSAFADTETVDGITWTYTVSNGKASLGGGDKSSPAIATSTTGSIAIPSTLGGYSVTTIGAHAFRGCSELTSITIPNGVTSIEYCAFYDCSGLTSITIPNSVTSIGGRAFCGCSGLTSITIPDSVTSIGAALFSNCSGLTSIFVVESNPVYDSRNNCSAIIRTSDNVLIAGCKDTIIPDSVTSIGDSAFERCSGLTSITIPNSVTNIGGSAFIECSGLTSIAIPNSVTNIGGWAFSYCTGLTSITIENGVTRIGVSAFSSCFGLTSITIPDSVTSIGGSAFSACGLKSPVYNQSATIIWCAGHVSGSFSIPNGVTSIGDWAFHGCSGLTSITIPDSVTNIGNAAFYLCSGLTSVTIPDGVASIGGSAFRDCSGLTSITIPDSVTSIGDSAFESCSGLTSISIPYGVTSIGRYAFSGCSELYTLNLPGRFRGRIANLGIPAECSVLFYDVVVLHLISEFGNSNLTMRVPCDSNSVQRFFVDSPVSSGTNTHTRYVCTGWTGTGSVPATGSGTNATFTIEEDSTLTWIWRQENRIAVSVSGAGSCDFGTQWIEDGATTTATIIPSTHLYSISLSGDTNGVTLAGTTLTIPSDQPRDISVTVNEVKLSLDVSTAHGMPTPAGTTEWSWGDSVSAFVEADAPVNGVRYACTGWTGTGSVPASGTDTNVTFTIEEDSTLTWNWRKENQIAVSVSGFGSCDSGTQWVEDGTTTTATIVPTTHLYSIALSGDTNGVTLAGTTLTIPSDGPRDIAVTIEEVKLSLDVFSEHGTGAPEPGRSVWSWGDVVTAAISSDEIVGGWQYVCTGWVGTCSVPASGTGTNLSFAIEEDSTLRWMWQTNVWIECAVSGDATAEPVAEWFPADTGEKVFPFEFDSTVFDWELGGDADGVDVDPVAKTVAIPADRPRNVSLRFFTAERAAATGGKPVVWASSGDARWRPVAETGASDGICLRSGAVGTNETSVLSTTVSGSGTLSFQWKISAARGDYCRFFVDGTEMKSITRAPNWATATFSLGSGTHALQWFFEKGTTSPTGANAAFVDDLDWRPNVSLSVTSSFGTPSPERGTWSHVYGDSIEATVAEPAVADGVRRTCTGWNGTGSVPASGAGAAVSFAITNDSSLVWNWHTDYRLDLALSGPVTADFAGDWFAAGETKVVHWAPSVPYYSVDISGTTYGATLDTSARTLALPADCARDVTLTVTEHVIDFSAEGPVTTDFAEVWGTDTNAPIVVRWTPTVPYYHVRLEGDADGVEFDEEDRTLTIPTTRSRTLALRVQAFTLADALDTARIEWTTDGVSEWFPQTAVSRDGADAAQSGAVGSGDDWSAIETTLDGPGTLSWAWRIEAEGTAGVDLIVDGEWLRDYAPIADWTTETLAIEGDGGHVVRFEFWNTGTEPDDRAWIDQVLWTGRAPVGGLLRLVSVGQTNAILTAVSYAGDGSVPVGRTLEVASDEAFGGTIRSVDLGAVTETEVEETATGPLEADSAYWARLRLSREGFEDIVSESIAFRTLPHTPPEIGYVSVEDVTKHKATAVVSIAALGSAGGPSAVFVSLFEPNGTSPIASRNQDVAAPGAISVSFDSLLPGTDYEIRVTARSDASGKEASEELAFRTADDMPPAGAIIDIEATAISAVANVRVYSLGDRFQSGVAAVVEVSGDMTFDPKTTFGADGVWTTPERGVVGISRLERNRDYFARAVLTSQPDGLVSTSSVVRFRTEWGETPRIEPGDGEYGTIPGVSIKTFLEEGIPVDYFVIRIANPVVGCYYTAYTNAMPSGPFAAFHSERVSAWDVFGSGPSYMIRVPADADAKFVKVGVTKFAVAPGTLETDVPEPLYSVRFHPNGGSGEMGDQTMELEVAAPLSGNGFEKPGWDFSGWATEENGSVAYADREVVDLGAWSPGQVVDLWAVWSLPDPFATALDCTNLTFTTGGGADWFVQTGEAHMGGSALRSGAISHNQSTWVETVINGPGTFSFWWKVSSESVSYDYVEVVIDGEQRAAIGGEGGIWTKQTYSFSGSGTHTIRWNYRKDGSDSSGSDCAWLDMVTWTETPEPEWTTGTYSWFEPANVADNLLRQPHVFFTGGTAGVNDNGYTMDNPNTMTDGMIDSADDPSDKRYRFAVTSGQTLSWAFPSPATIREVRVYNIWDDYGRNRIDIASVDAFVDGNWVPLALDSVHTNDPNAGLHVPGRPFVILSMTDGSALVTGATDLRIVWGTTTFVGVGEVEVIGSF